MMIADRADSVAQSVVVTVIHNINALELIMGKTRIDAPVMLLDFDRRSMVGYSWFAGKRLPCPYDSEAGFVKCLAEPGRRLNRKPAITPTGVAEVIALAKNRVTLDPYYRIPLPAFDTVDLLVNKKRFFQEVISRSIPCPKSYFPQDADEARRTAAMLQYQFVVKGQYSHVFIAHFHKKVFVVHSPAELEKAIELLGEAKLDFFFQEIVPGNNSFLFYSYFSRQCVPLGTCGYEKIRQFPKDFGIGTVCRAVRRPQPMQAAINFFMILSIMDWRSRNSN